MPEKTSLQKMHRRAQKAEGELSRMKQAHADAAERAFRSYIDYHLYAFLLLNCNPTLFPKTRVGSSVFAVPTDAGRSALRDGGGTE